MDRRGLNKDWPGVCFLFVRVSKVCISWIFLLDFFPTFFPIFLSEVFSLKVFSQTDFSQFLPKSFLFQKFFSNIFPEVFSRSFFP